MRRDGQKEGEALAPMNRREFTSRLLAALSAPTVAFCSSPRPTATPADGSTSATTSPLAPPPAGSPVEVTTAAARGQHGGARVGINLAGMADWNTELPFVDVFRMSRPWISQKEGARFGEGPKLDIDASGWVKRIEPNCTVETRLCGTDHVPPGEWTVLYDGEGDVEIWAQLLGQFKSPGKVIFKMAPGAPGGFFLRIHKTNPQNYVRNIRVLIPGSAANYASEPWNPGFVARWRGMAAVRFMDFMETNNSTQVKWSDRPQLGQATFSNRGVPVELLVDLANRLRTDPWFTMPHLADDDYVQNFASYVKEHLHPELCPHIEYSNEVWNNIFMQHRVAVDQGKAKKLAGDDFWGGMCWYGERATEVFKIWKRVLGPDRKLVRIIASQAANADVAKAILEHKDTAQHTDALAIAPYVSFNADMPRAEEVSSWSLDRLFAELEKEIPIVSGWMRNNKALADKHKLRLMAYEGGQHLVGVLGGENNDKTTKLFLSANADARMGGIYQRYHRAWMDAGGDLFCHFSSVSSWSKWGSWGLLQQFDDDPRRSPKFMEVMRWARECSQNVVVPG